MDPLWVQAWATVALFVAAVVAGVVTIRIYQVERERDRRYEQERLADQASHVAAWVRNDDFVLHNASPLPVYNVALMPLFVAVHELETETTGYAPDPIDVLPPGPPAIVPTSDEFREEVVQCGRDSRVLRITIEFTDAAGHHWIRDEHGALIEDFVDFSPAMRWHERLRARLPF